MKRKLSLLLAVVMILGSFSFVFADEDFNVPAFLEKNGILKGDKSGNLMLDKALERRDAVVLLSRLLKAEEEAKNYEPAEDEIYPDNNDPYYAGFLGWATANGYFEGYPNGNFKPRESILVQEFALVLLRALEYGDTEWKSVMDKAKELGILEGVKEADANAAILREDVAQMIFNALGVTMKDSDQTLAEFLGIDMPEFEADELEVVDVRTENLKEIIVELSNAKLVDEEKLTDVNNYRLAGFRVQKATVNGNEVILLLANTYDEEGNLVEQDRLVNGRKYELVIRGIDKDVNGKYEFTAEDNSIPVVEDVIVLGEYGIKVVTSEPVQLPPERNFLIDGKNVAMEVEQYGREIILTPYYNTTFPENAETLTVKQLTDFEGYRSVEEDFEIEIVKDEVAPEVVDVIARGNKVEVVFDKDIYNDSVAAYWNHRSVGNIYYESGRHKTYAEKAEKVDTNKVVYTFKDELPRRTVVTIVDVQNHSKVAMEETEMEARIILDYTEPEIIDTKVTTNPSGTATIKLYFDKDVIGSFVKNSNTEFIPEDHFALYVREVARRNELDPEKDFEFEYAKYDGDRRDVVVVELKGLKVNNREKEYDYILEIVDFTDTSGRNKMYRDYVDFEVKPASTAFSVVDVDVEQYTARTEITIVFNKPVDRVLAEDPTNYIFTHSKGGRSDVKDLDGRIITERNGKEVTLVLPEFKPADYANFRILDTLKDKDGARLDKTYTYDFATKTINAGEYTLSKNDDDHYVVTPNKGVEKVTLRSNLAATFIVEGDLEKLTIDAPYAHVVVNGNVEEVEILAIGSDSLEINGTVEKLVISTTKVVKVFGNVENMVVATTVDKAKVKVAFKTTDSEGKEIVGDFVEFELEEKGDEFKIKKEDGKPSRGETEEQELESAKEELSKAIKDAEKVLEEAKEILGEENEKVKELGKAINAAKVAVYEAKDIEEVESAETELKNAMKAVKDLLEEKAANEALLEEIGKAIGNEITVTVEDNTTVEEAVKNAIEALEIGEGDDKKTVGDIDGLNIDVDVTEDEEEGVKTYTAKITLTIGEDETEATKTIEIPVVVK